MLLFNLLKQFIDQIGHYRLILNMDKMQPQELKKIRNDLGLTQEQLAYELNMSEKSRGRPIRALESGERKISGPLSLLLKYIQKYGLMPRG